MRILAVSDKECPALWDHYRPEKLAGCRMILAAGDLKADYLSFLVTVAGCPVFYVHGNHDGGYGIKPPEGCDCIDGRLVVYRGVRILGLGGSVRYNRGAHQYTQRQMEQRVRKLRRAIQLVGGVDIVVTHAPPEGVGDWNDNAHRGFSAFLHLIDSYHPQYVLHGHVHMNYGHDFVREREYAGTKVINCWERYELDLEGCSAVPELSAMKKWYIKRFMKNLEIISL